MIRGHSPQCNAVKIVVFVIALCVSLVLLHQMYLMADFALAFVPAKTNDVLPSFDRHFCSTTQGRGIVPHVVHQLWKTRQLDTYNKKASYYEWKRRYPDWQIVLWDDASLEHLIASEFPWLLAYWRGLGSGIQRADVGRLVVLYRHGGVYADLDAPPSARTTDRLDTLCGGALLQHGTVLVRSSDGHIVTNHFMAAARGAPFLAYALSRLPAQSQALWLPYMRVFYTTGPIFVTRMLKEYVRMLRAYRGGTEINIQSFNRIGHTMADPIPTEYMEHLSANDVLVIDAANAWHLVEHEGGRSWVGADGRLLNWIADNGLVPFAVTAVLCTLVALTAWLTVALRRRTAYRSISTCPA